MALFFGQSRPHQLGSEHYQLFCQREKVAHLALSAPPSPLSPPFGGTMTAWLPPLPLLGEGGWGGEGQTCCVLIYTVWRYFSLAPYHLVLSSV